MLNMANSIDPDEMPRYAASHLALPAPLNAYAHWMGIHVVIFNLNKKQNIPPS